MSVNSNGAPARRRRLGLFAVWAAIALLVAAVGGGVSWDVHVQRSSGYCVRCHEAQARHPGGPDKHEGMSCQTCHTTDARHRFGLLGAKLLGRTQHLSPHGRLASDRCVSCHREDATRWRAVLATPGHASHFRGRGATDCARCHGNSLHGRPEASERCLSCHQRVPMLSEPRAEADCVRCHAFAPGSRAAQRGVGVNPQTASRVTVQQVHGSADCSACHNPHRAPSGPGQQPRVECRQCHQGRIHAEVSAGPEGHRACLGCHQVHAPRTERAVECGRCHSAPDDRALAARRNPPPGRRPAAQPTASPWRVAIREWLNRTGPMPAVGPVPTPDRASSGLPPIPENLKLWTHQGRCATCHRPHNWAARYEECRSCHGQQATTMSAVRSERHQSCDSCHQPHGPRPNAQACGRCHTNEARLSHGAPSARHQDCLGCHGGHAARPAFTPTCNRCHAPQSRTVRSGHVAHRECNACHTPHGRAAANTRAACVRCHTNEARSLELRGTAPAHQNCASCHARHDFSRPAARASCARCHAPVVQRSSAHRGDCAQCHQPHAGVPVPPRLVGAPAQQGVVRASGACTNCHAQSRMLVRGQPSQGHGRCSACHQPHRNGLDARQRCASCHANQVRAGASWPATSAHAGRCEQCHGMHREAAPVACASCHAPQATRTHTGRHTGCVGCHPAHQDRPREGRAGWWNRCSVCHTAQASSAARSPSTTHRNCTSCHQRAEHRAPTCVSCHTTITSMALHRSPSHRNCAGCHTNHGTPTVERTQCFGACHQAHRNHFPDAPRCQVCHVFTIPGAVRR